ncbi:MAG: hypothetical protein GPJ54_02235 [Candidatus Heimdallarchaeota archaeon]|nr:hypothetical protein [Candidatus Heimdallarchaeota archaeon]
MSHSTQTESQTINDISIIIDTDLAPDDFGAIIYLLAHESVTVKAITASLGLSYIDAGVSNVLKLLDHLGYDNIPVAAGQTTPTAGDNSFPDGWRDASNNFFGVVLPNTDLQPSTLNASELIVSIINETVEPITIVTLGAFTNVAIALKIDPTIVNKIDKIHSMGGAVNVAGNVGIENPNIDNLVAEWNLYIDPYAANQTFSSGIPITLVPLDATNDVPQTTDFQTQLAEIKQTPEADLLYQFLSPGLFFWDQLTAVALTNPQVITTIEYSIQIVVADENLEGQTKIVPNGSVNTIVAISADQELFEELLVSIVNNGIITSSSSSTSSDIQNSSSTTNDSNSETDENPIQWASGIFALLFIVLTRSIRNNKRELN